MSIPSIKWLVLTTINEPREGILRFAELGYKILVVGDVNTPKTWINYNPKVVFYSYEDQQVEFPELGNLIGSNTYARKNLGYLKAIKSGASIIWETDDDTFPRDLLIDPIDFEQSRILEIRDGLIWNPYSHFLPNKKVWPRGFPLERINNHGFDFEPKIVTENKDFDIIQTLVNIEPDLDAIYRLTHSNVKFSEVISDDVVALINSISPGNTQSTVWMTIKSFRYIYFPSLISDRFADILKMYIAQTSCLLGYRGFLVDQFRNKHDYFEDFKKEIPLYLNVGKLCDLVLQSKGSNIEDSYKELVELGICDSKELKILDQFQRNLSEIIDT